MNTDKLIKQIESCKSAITKGLNVPFYTSVVEKLEAQLKATIKETQLIANSSDDTEAAIAGVYENADDDYKEAALGLVEEFARTRASFSAFEVTSELIKSNQVLTHNKKVMGPIMRKAASLGLIEHSGQYTANLRGHHSPTPIWTSLVFDPREVAL